MPLRRSEFSRCARVATNQCCRQVCTLRDQPRRALHSCFCAHPLLRRNFLVLEKTSYRSKRFFGSATSVTSVQNFHSPKPLLRVPQSGRQQSVSTGPRSDVQLNNISGAKIENLSKRQLSRAKSEGRPPSRHQEEAQLPRHEEAGQPNGWYLRSFVPRISPSRRSGAGFQIWIFSGPDLSGPNCPRSRLLFSATPSHFCVASVPEVEGVAGCAPGAGCASTAVAAGCSTCSICCWLHFVEEEDQPIRTLTSSVQGPASLCLRAANSQSNDVTDGAILMLDGPSRGIGALV